jgi:CHAT domain-containing protein
MALSHLHSQTQQAPGKSHQVLAVGVTRGVADYPRLPGVDRELRQVTDWCRKRNIEFCHLQDDTANRNSIGREIQHATLAHFACHGVFSRDDLAGTGLLLIPAPDQQDLFSIFEIARLKLDNLRHVTLSSCWSADNYLLPGWHVISLPQTFIQAGANSVLGSLWLVSDDVASYFFPIFYEHLLELAPDEALRSTQLACLKNSLVPGLKTADPFFWAGYCLYGETCSAICRTRIYQSRP